MVAATFSDPVGKALACSWGRSRIVESLCWNPPVDNDAILEVALRVAASKGESDPESVECVPEVSRANVAHLFSGGGVSEDQDQPVVAVQVRGKFVGYGAKVPAGHTLPTGSVLKVELDSGGRVLGWGIGDQVADLAQLGEVVRLR